ncbi:MAG: tRNA (adenosine(37)-N6)-dimethylallyltransferase MiaA [Chlorobium sp.]|nr:MAG: tRNA (adenosine(37)-N6)-dimethylallyltransferase MiaA [Chlorobium sp.]
MCNIERPKNLPPVIVILGPTASGKSALALAIAKKTGAEIISADSRQIYRELDIGAAKPSSEVLQEVKHHFVNEKNIGEPFTAGDFAIDAVERIHDIHKRGGCVVVAGGSTLYLEGMLKGFADLPPSNPEIRARLLVELDQLGNAQLYERLRQSDPVQAATLDPTKSQRLIRSLEIMEITGKSVTELQSSGKARHTGLRFITFGLSMPREILYQRINQRTDAMIDAGLRDEAEQLYHKYRDLLANKETNALKSVGYQELFHYFDGAIDFPKAVQLIKQHTRNYAKRQLTFFNNRLPVAWVEAPNNSRELATLATTIVDIN